MMRRLDTKKTGKQVLVWVNKEIRKILKMEYTNMSSHKIMSVEGGLQILQKLKRYLEDNG